MSNPYLPREVLDYIVELLYGDPNALKLCCLVDKSWTPRSGNHHPTYVTTFTGKHLESWKKMFPDFSTSPAHFTRSLHADCTRAVTVADAEPGGWFKVSFITEGSWRDERRVTGLSR